MDNPCRSCTYTGYFYTGVTGQLLRGLSIKVANRHSMGIKSLVTVFCYPAVVMKTGILPGEFAQRYTSVLLSAKIYAK